MQGKRISKALVKADSEKQKIFTIGHSTRTFREFLELLKAHSINRLVDIRTIPRSRFNPQFNQQILKKRLKNHSVSYVYMKGLGGLRKPLKDSKNKGWRHPGFRGFADYMQTEEFEKN